MLINCEFDVLTPAAGKKPDVDTQTKHELFESKLSALIIDGKLASSKNQIYTDITRELGNKMSKQAVYLSVKRYMQNHHPSAVFEIDTNPADDGDSDNDEEFLPSDKFKTINDGVQFSIDIRDFEIFPEKDKSEGDEWKSELLHILWEFSRLPCAWRFERYREVCNEVNMHGDCGECEGKLFIHTTNGKNQLIITIQSCQPDVVHNRKIVLPKTMRNEIREMLKSEKSCVVQAKLADRFMVSHDLQPAHLPNLHTMHQIQYEANKQNRLHDDPAIALKMMKKLPLYHQFIGDIGLDPFFVSYSNEFQKEYQRQEINHRRCVVSIDSTGMQTLPI